MAARAMGYRVAVLDPDPDCPAAPIADLVVVGCVRRRRGGAAAGRASDVVTYELEHVAAAVVEAVEARVRRSGPAPRAAARDPGSAGRAPVRRGGRRSPSRRGARSGPWRTPGPRPRRSACRCGSSCRSAAMTAAASSGSRTAAELDDAWERLGAAAGVAAARRARARLRDGAVGRRRSRGRGEVATFPIGRNVHDAGILVETVRPGARPGRGRADARPRSGPRWPRRWTCGAR